MKQEELDVARRARIVAGVTGLSKSLVVGKIGESQRRWFVLFICGGWWGINSLMKVVLMGMCLPHKYLWCIISTTWICGLNGGGSRLGCGAGKLYANCSVALGPMNTAREISMSK